MWLTIYPKIGHYYEIKDNERKTEGTITETRLAWLVAIYATSFTSSKARGGQHTAVYSAFAFAGGGGGGSLGITYSIPRYTCLKVARVDLCTYNRSFCAECPLFSDSHIWGGGLVGRNTRADDW